MARILIVEDEKGINDLILQNLTLVGHTPEQAFDGREARSTGAHRVLPLSLRCGRSFRTASGSL